jgi:hypothetical protein
VQYRVTHGRTGSLQVHDGELNGGSRMAQGPAVPRSSRPRGMSSDGRVVVGLSLAVYLLAVTVSRTLAHVDIWPWLGVPSGPSLFFDAQNVAAAAECSRLGHDPLVDNPCDPWGRAMFYPRVWLGLRWLHLTPDDTVLFGSVVVAVFLLSLFLLLPRIDARMGVVVSVVVCSPAIMFAVERANMDLVVFSGLALAVVVWRRGGRSAEVVAVALVLLMAIAKLYPAVALLAFLVSRRRTAVVSAGISLILFTGYLLATWSDIQTITRTATQGQEHSYGARILLSELYHAVNGGVWAGSPAVAQVLVLVVAGSALALTPWVWARLTRRRTTWRNLGGDDADQLAFRLGALVYVGTFLAGNNFDYRLVSVLLTLPLLLHLSRQPSDRHGFNTLPVVALSILALSLWISALSRQLHLWDELTSWALAGALVALLVRSAPPSTRSRARDIVDEPPVWTTSSSRRNSGDDVPHRLRD